MKTSDAINEIVAALATAQKSIKTLERDRSVDVETDSGSYGFSYATLSACFDACRLALADQGVVIVQGTETDGQTVTVDTRLAHSSGQWIESQIRIRIPTKKDKAGAERTPGPQEVGSAITYARRYGLSAMVGLAAEEDDDGNAAHGNKVTTRQPNPDCPKCGKPNAMVSTRPGPKYWCNPKEYKGHTGCGNSFDTEESKAERLAAGKAATEKIAPTPVLTDTEQQMLGKARERFDVFTTVEQFDEFQATTDASQESKAFRTELAKLWKAGRARAEKAAAAKGGAA